MSFALCPVNYAYSCSSLFDRSKVAANFYCQIFGTNYTRSNKLKIHLQKKHNVCIVGGHSRRTKLTFPRCSELFYHKSKMTDHLNTHNHVNAQKEVLNVPNEKKFQEWKKKEELSIFVHYSKQRGDGESKMIIHKHFVRLHDGKAKTHRKAAEPVRKTSQKFSSQPLSKFSEYHISTNTFDNSPRN